ncbi:VOC family protein [Lacrimispora sphenoides]|uniref:Lactoylglutathione lyase n=1 Tax=Lacrimispora sphenoides JCM 1415 TaxID=1297793 RepID=A0ABY1CF63_9FIRM|nr:VOC family protein [Lacrimispora sphenoides]SET97643.1 lactoylglutathione lyase [[Clostridium] sphenoides JCM 1415]SUY52894.1 Glyoxalase/bleomycin resistance protein/dioxygenase [Lacrimispora sphenoides]
MKFCWSTLNVRNLEESIKFYEEIIGLRVNRRFPAGPGTEIAFLGDGETQIELICGGDREIQVGDDISWGFEVKSLDQTLSLAKEKGVILLGEPVQPNPHVRFAFIKDPNGMRVQLVETLG